MNRSLCLLFGCLLAGAALAQSTAAPASPVIPESRVVQVTVYAGWAYVTREATIAAAAGRGTYVVADIPSWIDQDSVRATAGGETVRILAATARTVFREQRTQAEVEAATAAALAANAELTDLQTSLTQQEEVLKTEREYLLKLMPWKLGNVPQESMARKVTGDELKEVANLAAALKENDTRAIDVQRQTRELLPKLREKVQALEKALEETKRLHKLERCDLIVDLEAPTAGPVTLQVGYLISGASWYPSYDIRTDAARTAVQLGCSAVVQQTTGEDWSNAQFALSTVNPYSTRALPTLQPWHLAAGSVRQAQAPYVLNEAGELAGGPGDDGQGSFRLGGDFVHKASQIQQKLVTSNRHDASFNKAYALLGTNVALAVKVVRQAEVRGTTAEFVVAGAHTVKPDGVPVKLPVGDAALAATCQYIAVPVVSASTYVSGRMTNTGTFPLLPGPVYVFVNRNLIGKTDLDLVAQGEKFELYLGLEERVKVERTLDASRSSSALFSDNKRLNLAYTLNVRNLLDRSASLTLQDQVPISQDGRFKVKLLRTKPEAVVTPDGIMTWEIAVEPNQTQTVTYEYQVEYPAGVSLEPVMRLEDQVRAAQ